MRRKNVELKARHCHTDALVVLNAVISPELQVPHDFPSNYDDKG